MQGPEQGEAVEKGCYQTLLSLTLTPGPLLGQGEE